MREEERICLDGEQIFKYREFSRSWTSDFSITLINLAMEGIS